MHGNRIGGNSNMHHLLEIFVLLLLALVIGWLIGWFLRCVLFRREQRAPELPKASAPQFKPAHKPVQKAAPATAVATLMSAANAEKATNGTGAAKAASQAKAATGGSTADAGTADSGKGTTAAGAARTAAAAGTAQAAADTARADSEAMPVHGLSAPVGGKADDLQMISGIGPKLEKMLHDQGIFHFAQIAAWKKKDIEEIDARLKFKGRIEREEWVRQAKLLAAGKLEQFEREYGTGGKKGADGKTRSGSRTRRGAASVALADTSGAAKSKSAARKSTSTSGSKTATNKSAAGQAMPTHGLSAPVGGKADDLQMISGIGPKLEKMLHDRGIFHFAQIAAWKKKDIEEIDARLKFKGRIEREEWVRQAKLLAAGKLEQFEREYGTGGKKDASGQRRSGSRTRKGGRN